MSRSPREERDVGRVPFLDLASQHAEIAAEIDAALARVLRASAFIGGEEVDAFEAEFAAYCGAAHCVGVGNGTDALVLALRALGVGVGDAVLTVPFTFIAAAEAIDLVGAEPVFVDIGPDYTLDVEAAARVVRERRIAAIIAVHLFGLPADMAGLRGLAAPHRIPLIEDAAQAHGARLRLDGDWRRAGALGDVACFSFYPTKNLGALGDAGAVTTDDAGLASRVRQLGNHGQARKYEHLLRRGSNSRLDGLQAAVLRVKLRELDRWNAARRAAASRYRGLLADTAALLPEERPGAESVFHQYVVRVSDRDDVRRQLGERGIETAVHYPVPIHAQPAYAPLGLGPGSHPVSEQAAREVLSLPLSPHITASQQEQVASALRQVLAARTRPV